MTRKTSREISRIYAAEKTTNPGAVAVLSMNAVGTDKSLRYIATVTIGAAAFDVAGDNGRLKVFADVDGFLKFAAKAAEKGDGVYTVSVNTGALLASTVPADLQSWAVSQGIKLGKTKIAQNAVIAGLDTQLALMVGWESGNAAQQVRKAELQAQRVCVVTDVAAIDTEIARLAVIAAG